MSQLEQMKHCTIIGPTQYLSATIKSLYNLGLYHITPHLKGKYNLDLGQPFASAETISAMLLQIRKVIAAFPVVTPLKIPELTEKKMAAVKKGVEKLYHDFLQVEELQQKLERQRQELAAAKQVALLLKKASLDITALQKSTALAFFIGTIQKTENLHLALPKNSYLLLNNYILMITPSTESATMTAVLATAGFIPFTNFSLLSHVQQQIIEFEKQKTLLQKKQLAITQELPLVTALQHQLEEELRKQELPLRFAVTERTFLATGWIPAAEEKKFNDAVGKATNQKVHVECKEPDHHTDAPVKFHNQRLVSPFEFLLHLYDLPKYREIDPSSLLFFTFPLFFGFMLGDFGYALVLTLLFYYLRKKIPAAKQLMEVLLFAAVISMLFGVVFGEYFGFEHLSESTGAALCDKLGFCLPRHEIAVHGAVETVYDFPRLLQRTHGHMNVFGYEILSVLVIGAIIGFIHLNIGFIVGFINEYHAHGLKHAILAKLSWLIVQAGLIMVLLSATGIWALSSFIGTAIAIIGAIMLIVGEGIQGAIELPALFSNMLSYMRLGAVGLASVGLAVVVNENLALPLFQKGGIFILIGILVMIMGHAINILLGVIGPFLHGVRLHYVEFFSKFFKGGGELYQPFAKRKQIGGTKNGS